MAEAESTRPVVCDAGPLIHLDELGCTDLLRDFAGVFVAETVWQEVARHRPMALRRRSFKMDRQALLPEASHLLQELAKAFALDAGEYDSCNVLLMVFC